MSSQGVKLHGFWASPFTCRIKLALRLKGIEYEYVEEDLSNKSRDLLKHNPVYKKTPVLVHDEKPISESRIIMEYIDETWRNNPLLPADPFDRSVVHFWAKFVDEQIFEREFKRKEEEKGREMEETCQRLKLIENEIKEKEFFGGESIGYLDIVVFSLVYWTILWEEACGGVHMVSPQIPCLCEWIKRLLHTDFVKEIIPPKEKHVTFFKSIYAVKNDVVRN